MLGKQTFGIFLVITLAACVALRAAAQNYYPTTLGNIWVMETEDGTERLTYTVEASDEVINGKKLGLIKLTTETLGADFATTEKFFVDFEEDSIKLYKVEVDLGPIFGVATALVYPPVLLYPLSPALGDSWTVTLNSEITLAGPITLTSVNEVVAIEDVVTPIGRFEDCIKIRLRTKATTKTSIMRGTTYQWLAPDLGPVKFENTQDIVYELVSFTVLADVSPYDVTGDGVVNILDLVFVASRFGQADAEADVNNDGIVNILDLTLIAGKFGT